MLEILRARGRADFSERLRSFDPARETWVVSDLRTKFELQEWLLDTRGAFVDESVLRASDLWKLLLKRRRPELRVVSRDFIRSVIRSWLEENRDEWKLNPVAEKGLVGLMDRFAALIYHPGGARIVQEWLRGHPESLARWGDLYAVALQVFARLDRESLITSSWVSSFLLSQEDLARHWSRPLIFDLGAEMTSAEALLVKELSRSAEVQVLEPDPQWREEVRPLLRPYEQLVGFAAKRSILPSLSKTAPQRRALRFAGRLGEVKQAVSQIRVWLETGTEPFEIGVFAPDIEAYWPVLKPHLDEEGIPTEKSLVGRLSALPGVSRWLSRLRSRSSRLSAGDLELSLYGEESESSLPYEEFRALFLSLLDESDLSREKKIEAMFQRGVRFQGLLSRDEFLSSAAQLWDGKDSLQGVSLFLREVLQNATSHISLPALEWIRYAEAICAAKEFEIEAGVSDGVLVTNLLSARSSKIKKRLYLGLNEENLKNNSRSPVPREDIQSFAELGFQMEHPDQSLPEFELRWQADSGQDEDHFYTSMTDFEGTVMTPSSRWVRLFREIHPEGQEDKTSVAEPSRWDELRAQAPEEIARLRAWSQELWSSRWKRVLEDRGEKEPEPFSSVGRKKLSPSQVKKHRDCPFHSAAGLFFRLSDEAALDLDLDSRSRGNLLHEVFSAITDQGLTVDSLDQQGILALLDEQRQKSETKLGDDRFWPPFRLKLAQIVSRFLKIEAEWKKNFPSLKIHPSETSWQIWFDPAQAQFYLEDAPGRFRLSGRIDRLESDAQGHYVVVDYKSSPSGLNQAQSWIEKNDLQLLFYMWALEKEALPNQQGEIWAAFYYVMTTMERSHGLCLEGKEGVLFPAGKKSMQVSLDQKKAMFADLEQLIQNVVRDLEQGQVHPRPRQMKICEQCPWGDLCRAPHLN